MARRINHLPRVGPQLRSILSTTFAIFNRKRKFKEVRVLCRRQTTLFGKQSRWPTDLLETGAFYRSDADNARNYFKAKSRKKVDKTTSIAAAVKELISDGDYIAIGGFGVNRIPTAALHELVRQRKKNLGLSGHTATHDFQILAAGECINRCDVAYVVGLEARGLSKRRAGRSEPVKLRSPNGPIRLAWRYKAAAMGVSSFRPEACCCPIR